MREEGSLVNLIDFRGMGVWIWRNCRILVGLISKKKINAINCAIAGFESLKLRKFKLFLYFPFLQKWFSDRN